MSDFMENKDKASKNGGFHSVTFKKLDFSILS